MYIVLKNQGAKLGCDQRAWVSSDLWPEKFGEHRGIVVDHQTFNQEVLGSIPTGYVVSLSKAHLLPRLLVNTHDVVVASRHV